MKSMCLKLCTAMCLVVLVACSITRADEEEKEQKAAQAAIDAVAGKTDAEIEKAAKDLAEKYPIDIAMVIFKTRARGGIGVGKEGEVRQDGIELQIGNLARRKITPLTLKRSADALVEMAKRTKVMAEITRHQPTRAAKDGKGAEEWKKYLDEMKEGSNELIKAVEASDGAKVQEAAKKMNSSCINCHSEFRD